MYQSPSSAGASWKHTEDFIHGPDGLLATRTRGGGQRFFLKDHLGTPRAITNGFGNVLGRHHYYPFGGEVQATLGQEDQEVSKFTGHERDASGLSDYMLARTYFFPIYRFASVDSARDGWNLYTYVRNNPIGFVDPTGLVVEYASTAAQEAYEAYRAGLETDSIDYQTLEQLESSEVTYVINIEDTGGSKDEGSVTTDGERVFVNVDPAAPNDAASFRSRLAHELEHARQFDSGEFGFLQGKGKWGTQFADITDEIKGWEAQSRQSTPETGRTVAALGPLIELETRSLI